MNCTRLTKFFWFSASKVLLLVGLLWVVVDSGFSQIPSSQNDPLDLDSLFNDDTNQPDQTNQNESPNQNTTAQAQPSQPGAQPSTASPLSLLDRIQARPVVEFTGSYRMALGYSGGFADLSVEPAEFQHLPVIETSASLNLRLNISPVLTVRTGFRFSYPEYEIEVTQLYADYLFGDGNIWSVGRRNLTWGRSPNFPFGNLLNRRADAPISDVVSNSRILSRFLFPIGIGDLEFVMVNQDSYHELPRQPDPTRLGFGFQYTFARPQLELDVRGFYQSGMKPRLAGSAQYSPLSWLELYTEGVLVYGPGRRDSTGLVGTDKDGTGTGNWILVAPGVRRFDNPVDFGLALGAVASLWEENLTLNVEWYYNGEEAERRVPGTIGRIFWGHNLALNGDLKIPNTDLRFRLGFRSSLDLASSILLPRVDLQIARHLTVTLGGGMVFGPGGLGGDSGQTPVGFAVHNPDPANPNRPVFFGTSLVLSGRF